MLPTAFLPVLPKAQYTLHPLDPREIASLTSILRELYLPPVHGGLDASDAFYDDNADIPDNSTADEGTFQEKEKQRQFSKGLAESIGTLNLALDGRDGRGVFGRHLVPQSGVGSDGDSTPRAGSGTATPIPISRTSSHAPYNGEPCHLDDADSNGSDTEEEEEEGDTAHLDPFEREWAQKWLQGVVRRAQTWIEQTGDDLGVGEMDGDGYDMKSVEGVLKDATAVLAVMAGTGAAGSLTRHLLFPISPSLTPGLIVQQSLKAQASLTSANAAYSPETRTFLASLIHANDSNGSGNTFKRARSGTVGSAASYTSSTTTASDLSSSSCASASYVPRSTRPREGKSKSKSKYSNNQRGRRHRRPAIPILLHDAPISDHLDVGVQTWGSAILLGRELAMRPEKFGLLPRPRNQASSSAASGQVGAAQVGGDASEAGAGSGDGKGVIGERGVRVLELGAGTGLLGILCRKLLDLHSATNATSLEPDENDTDGRSTGTSGFAAAGTDHLVLATDFLPSVLNNLQICIDLNFPSSPTPLSSHTSNLPSTGAVPAGDAAGAPQMRTGVEVAKLDWVTFPAFASRYYASRRDVRVPPISSSSSQSRTTQTSSQKSSGVGASKYPLERTIARPQPIPSATSQTDGIEGPEGLNSEQEEGADDAENPMMPYMDAPFDLVLVSDCVYDPTHAEMIRQVAGWVLRPPNPAVEGDMGGTMHILSPLRPTFAPELESIDTHFPVLSLYPPPCAPKPSSSSSSGFGPASGWQGEGAGQGEESAGVAGEGLGYSQGLRIGTRGTGKRSVRGKKGEGRVDEEGGYWWWEVGWG